MRKIANDVYIPVLKELVEEGKEVSMMISGSSMNPFLIHQRDYILMRKPERELKVGDMVFFQRNDGAYLMHRIHHINKKEKLFIISNVFTTGSPKDVFNFIFMVKDNNISILTKANMIEIINNILSFI